MPDEFLHLWKPLIQQINVVSRIFSESSKEIFNNSIGTEQ